MKLILIRHGETYSNQKGAFLGFSESALTPRGEKMAQFIAETLKETAIEKVYASPSLRVKETLMPFLRERKLSIETVEALREIHFGIFEGKDFKWVKTNAPEELEKMIKEKDAYCYPQGESLEQMHERIASWLSIVLKQEEKVQPETAFVIAAHGGTIRSILSELLSQSIDLHWHFKIDLGSISVVNVTDGFAVLETLNKVREEG